jgi:FKBP-type peptidyl-prolyl cis-trans isomerase 2
LAPGARTTISVPATLAYGLSDPARIRRFARTRFAQEDNLQAGQWRRVLDRQGRQRGVRILQVCRNVVVVDTNRRWAGQVMELEVELIGIQAPSNGPERRAT